jgi:hypothetical protein
MRSDMGRVVIERPRARGWVSYKDVRNRRDHVSSKIKKLRFSNDNGEEDFDMEDDVAGIEVGGIEKMRQPNYDKTLTDLLGPIQRYLQSKIGTHWDAVWSDVCANLRGTHAVEHVRDHVEQMVNFAGGTSRWYRNGVATYEDIKYASYGTPMFYVDEDGILRRQLKKPESTRIWLRGSDYYVNNRHSFRQRLRIIKPVQMFSGYSFYKDDPNDLVWTLHYDERSVLFTKQKLSPAEQKHKENLENFRLYIYEGVEYVFIHRAWFKFEKAKLGDLKVKTYDTAVEKCPVPYSNITVYSAAKAEGTRFYSYGFYDIMGNHTSTYTQEFDKNMVIRHKFYQVSHSELKRVGLI